MPRANPLQPVFNAGELSPRLAARVDFSKYANAGARVENLIPLPQGGLTRRPGTRFVAAAGAARLIPFLFSSAQAYVIEAGDGYFRFCRDQAQIVVQPTDAAIANGSFDGDIAGWDDLSSGAASISSDAGTGLVPQGEGTAIGDMTGSGGLAAAFDGNKSQTSTQSASKGGTNSGSVGKDWGAGNARTIARAKVWASSNEGFVVGSNPTVTLTLEGWDVFPGGTNSVLATKNVTDANGLQVEFEPGDIDQSTAYRYHTIRVAVGTSEIVKVAEVEFYEPTTEGDRLALNATGSDTAHAEQDVTTTNTGQEHVISLCVEGDPGDRVMLQIGSTSGGNQLIADRELGVGCHLVAFTPDTSPFYVQFLNGSGKTVYVDDVSLLGSGAGAAVPLELMTPYPQAAIPRLKWAQSADVMYIACGECAPMKLERRGNTTWSLVRVDFEDGPWLDENLDDDKTIQPSAASGLGITLTASGHKPFRDADVGRLVRLKHSATWGWAAITAVDSPTVARADVRRDFGGTGAVAAWRLGAWNDTDGWPSVVNFFEQRLVWAGSTARPQTLWFSQSVDLENMRPDSLEEGAIEVQDDDALDYTIAADQVNRIVWLSPGRQLAIGTSGGEWTAASDGPVVTPTDIVVKRQSTNGCADIQPLRLSAVVLFLQRARRKLREFVFAFETDGFATPDLTVLADHVTESGIVELAWQQEPDSLVHCLRADGAIASLTYRREQEVAGWARHILGGAYEGGPAVVESLAVVPGSAAAGSAERDELWLLVKRTIAGQTRRSLEVMAGAFDGPARDLYDDAAAFEAAVRAAQTRAFHLDCGLAYDGAPATVLSGLDHLEGETVKILADGALHPDRVVTGGQVTLDVAASRVQVGLGYRHSFLSLKATAGAAAGTALGKVKRIHAVTAVLLHSAGVMIGTRERLTPLPLRRVDQPMDAAVPLLTGEYRIALDGDHARDPRLRIEGDAPLPFTLLALAPELKTNEQV